MTTIPVAGYFSNPARINSEAKQAFDDLLAVLRELPGGEAVTTLTIAAGVVVPTRAVHLVDTEGLAATDDLDRIANTNHPDGRIIVLGTVDQARDVTVRHGLATSGNNLRILLAGGVDLVLSDPSMRLVLQRRGTDWVEILRDYGTETSAARARLRVGGPWTDVASASTVNLGAAASTNIRITGTTTITSLGSTAQSGETYALRFAGALTLTHNATSLILPGGANIVAAAGDTAQVAALGSGNWVVTEYQRANGQAVVGGGSLIAADGAAATNRGLRISTSGTVRWDVIAEATAETGANAGSNFALARYSDAGTLIDVPLSINRATGRVTAAGLAPVPETAAGVGQWVTIALTASTYSLPAGGTWAYSLIVINGGVAGGDASVAAGGTQVGSGGGTFYGFAWRIA